MNRTIILFHESGKNPPFCRMAFRWFDSGFTLVEILISLAIVAILSALVISASKSIFSDMQKTQCLYKMKQLTGCILEYSTENNGDLLPWIQKSDANTGKPWHWELMDQGILPPNLRNISSIMGSFLDCPARGACNPSSTKIHYGMNTYPGFSNETTATVIKKYKMAKIANPAKTICLGETSLYYLIPWGGDSRAYPHFGGMNVTFYDGHGEWLSEDNLPFIKVYATTHTAPYY